MRLCVEGIDACYSVKLFFKPYQRVYPQGIQVSAKDYMHIAQ